MNTPETFRDKAIADFSVMAKTKYDKGQVEHGGFLVDRADFDDIEEEIVDLWFYVRAMRQRLERLQSSQVTVGSIQQSQNST